MAISAKFTRTLPAPSATISGGFVFLLSAGWFTQANTGAAGSPIDGGTNSLANGGGDMKIFSDTAATTQLPIEVVSFVTGGSPSAQVWVRTPSYTAGDTITIGKDDTQTVQPAVGAAFGRDAAWADWEIVSHDGVTDSTGNYPNAFSITGTPTVVNNRFGDAEAYDFDGNNDFIDADTTSRDPMNGVVGATEITIEVWVSGVSSGTNQRVITAHGTSQGFLAFGFNNSVSGNVFIGGNTTNSTATAYRGSSVAGDVFYGGSMSLDETTLPPVIVANESEITLTTNTNLGDGSASRSIRFGGRNDGANDFNGIASEFRYGKFGSSTDRLKSSQNNYLDPDNFGTSSEYILVGGGGSTLTADSGAYLYTGTDAQLLTTRILKADTGAYLHTGASVSLLKGFVLTANSGSYSYLGQDATLTYTPAGAFILTADSGNYTYTGSNINFNRDRVIIASSGTYNYSGTDIQIILPGQIWTDKPSASTNWNNQTVTTTIWTDK